MHFSAVRWLWPACVVALAACSDPKPSTSQQQSAVPKPALATPDTVAAAPATPPAPDTAAVQDVAAYLAGQRLSQGSALRSLAQQAAWQAYAADAEKRWASYHATRTNKIEQWAATELDSVRRQSPVIFYPFSGPDLLNVVTMFPTSQTYVLMGLEPVGEIPERTLLENPGLFPALQSSLWSVLNFSFFRTNDMAVELTTRQPDNGAMSKANAELKKAAKNSQRVTVGGVVPLLLLFAARTNHQVTAVRYVQLDTEGQLAEADSATISRPGLKRIPGVELAMRDKAGREKKAYYFSADLSDWKLGQTKEAALKYVRSLGPLTTYVKSASYLMHKPYFSKVRNLALERSRYLLQDDSGIAMKYFQPVVNWQLTYYGTYKRPINLFAKHYQPQLTRAYSDTVQRVRPLPFGTGYNWRQNDSNLLLARRRTPPVE